MLITNKFPPGTCLIIAFTPGRLPYQKIIHPKEANVIVLLLKKVMKKIGLLLDLV
jgi:hypothetical protein